MRRHWDDHELVWICKAQGEGPGWYWYHKEDGPAAGPFDCDEDAYDWVSKFL